jgi:hypothetical protein
MLADNDAFEFAERVLRLRRSRTEIMQVDLFSEPAWDLLLETLLAGFKGQRLTGYDVARNTNLAPTVMLRWIRHLNATGVLVAGEPISLDRELVLSPKTIADMHRIFIQPNQKP